MNINRIALIVLGACWSTGPAVAAQGEVRAQVDRDTVFIGQPITYTLEIRVPPSAAIAGDPVIDFQKMDLVQMKRYEPVSENGRFLQRIDYVLTSFAVDTVVIGAPVVSFVRHGDTTIVQGKPVRVVIGSVLDSTATDIRPEKPLLRADVRWWLLGLLVVLTIAGLGLLGWLVARQVRKYRLQKLAERSRRQVVIRTPEEIALEALGNLKASRLAEQGYYKQFHIEISMIVRSFIEQKYGIQAMEMPTSDLVAECRATRLDENLISLLRRFLEACDLVKFAKHAPSPSECGDLMDDAFTLVKLASTDRAVAAPVTA